MSGLTRTSAGLDARRRRILFRAWHRGMREVDLVVGPFADATIASLSDAEVGHLERLLDVPDHDILAWVTGESEVLPDHDTALWRKLVAFHSHPAPLHS